MKVKSRKSPGFALVSTILLLVLLAIITVGLLGLSTVTLRSTQEEMAMAVARANARMALMIAIGEIQKEHGPDQRINAPASQMTGDEEPVAGRKHWVGVYDAWDSTTEVLRPGAPNFRRWLVSGSQDVAKKIDAPKDDSSYDVVLWQGVDPDGADRVSAPLVNVSSSYAGGLNGGFAWWVGDENSKALVKRYQEPENNLVNAMRGVQAPGSVAFHNHPTLAGLARSDAKFDKLFSYKTMDLLGADPAAAAKSFHDLTPFSLGVITDVARGGLKRDLSLFLDHPVAEPLAVKLPNERRLYENGITWEELWLFHNAWRALEPPHPNLQSRTGGNLANTQILMTKPGTAAASVIGFRTDPYSFYKVPKWIRQQWLVSLWTQAVPNTDPQEYDIYVVSDPITTLWNPLDVPIALHPDAYVSQKIHGIPYRLALLRSDGTTLVSATHRRMLGFNEIGQSGVTNGHRITHVLGTAPTASIFHKYGSNYLNDPADSVVLMPGEVLIMSTGGPGNPQNWGTPPSRYRLKAGWNQGRAGRRLLISGVEAPAEPLTFRATAYNTHFNTPVSVLNYAYHYAAETNHSSQTDAPPDQTLSLGSVTVWTGSNPNTKNATHFPDVFPSVTVNLPSFATMTGNGKHPVMLVSQQMKTEDSPTASMMLQNTRNLNGRLDLVGTNAEIPRYLATSSQEVKVDALSGMLDSKMIQLSTNQINRGLFGGSYWDHSRGQDTVIALSVPREPPLSLGAFQHAVASGNTQRMNNEALIYSSLNRPDISRAISNSYALPVLAPDATETGAIQDHSYHVNRMLWDSWFVSSIAQAQAPHHPAKKTAREIYEDFIGTAEIPLPNSRMKSWTDSQTAEALFEQSEDPHELASSKLMIEGAFNVNSTSVEAWKALFNSLEDAFVPVSKGTNSPGAVDTHKPEMVTVPSLLTPYGNNTDQLDEASFEGAATATPDAPAQWRGNRKLKPEEIDELATAMVEEVKARGPFLSMADFVNRRPYADEGVPFALRGPLQAALDKTVNKEIFAAANRLGTAPADVGFEFPEAAQLPKSMTTSAHVLQADMLTAIGPQLTVRSDTFRIRTYGESRDKNGKVLAKAWCEAVVQRIPTYVDPIDPPQAADAPNPDPEPRNVPLINSQTNRNFGRSIEMISFRWLNPSEIVK